MKKDTANCRQPENISESNVLHPQEQMLKRVQQEIKTGFTLIELLVVVLIIGILSAVALPQYQKAVEKSRAAEAFVTLKSLADASSVWYLANGSYTDITQDKLDIKTEPDTKNFTFTVGGSAVYAPNHMDLIASSKKGGYILVSVNYNGRQTRIYCHTSSNTAICNSLGAKNCAANTECNLQ